MHQVKYEGAAEPTFTDWIYLLTPVKKLPPGAKKVAWQPLEGALAAPKIELEAKPPPDKMEPPKVGGEPKFRGEAPCFDGMKPTYHTLKRGKEVAWIPKPKSATKKKMLSLLK